MFSKSRYNFGIEKEELLKPKLEEHYGLELANTGRYGIFDFVNENKKLLLEIKSRTFKRSKYETTLIGLNKYIYALEKLKEGYETVFVFYFTDSVCTFDVTLNNVDTSWKCGNNLYIPIENLKKIYDVTRTTTIK
jgi:CRISPR/Cas system-associated exonuclease Cas4 (RecB family)